MALGLKLTPSRRGAWIINTTKHLVQSAGITHPGLSSLDNLCFAGKCGSLLIKLSADSTEQLPYTKVKTHARLCGISAMELPLYLGTLKALGCIDWSQTGDTYEVLASSRHRVLVTTSLILDGAANAELENALLYLLEFCLLRPRLESELKLWLVAALSERDVELLLGLVREFELLGTITIRNRGERLYFNGHQFGDRAKDIGNALAALSTEQREELNSLLDEVARRPGTPPENLPVSEEIKTMAIGLGLLEVSEVASPAGTAKFLTSPRLAPPSVGSETNHLEDDVFHHAKMLLSSLRFGQLRSSTGRGRIVDPPVLVNALLDQDRVGPCTAIGEDYVLLEGEGVIRTVTAPHKPGRQFYMELRRREPAEIVLGILQTGTSSAIDAKSLPRSLELPLDYAGPEVARAGAARKMVARDPETVTRFLEELRT